MTPGEFVQRMIGLGIDDARLEPHSGPGCPDLPTGTLPDGSGIIVSNSDGDLPLASDDCYAGLYESPAASAAHWPGDATGLAFNEPIDFADDPASIDNALGMIAIWLARARAGEPLHCGHPCHDVSAAPPHEFSEEPDAEIPRLVRAHCSCGWHGSGYAASWIVRRWFDEHVTKVGAAPQ